MSGRRDNMISIRFRLDQVTTQLSSRGYCTFQIVDCQESNPGPHGQESGTLTPRPIRRSITRQITMINQNRFKFNNKIYEHTDEVPTSGIQSEIFMQEI